MRIHLNQCSLSVLLFGSLGILGIAVSHAADISPEQLEFFEKKIRPVLATECYSCHSAEAGTKLKGGLRLDTRELTLKGGDTGPAIVPNDPAKSLALKAIQYSDDNLLMPPKKRLPKEVVADFEAWIKMGAPDPRTGTAVVATGPKMEDGRKFWAFTTPKDSPPPAVKNAAWVKNNIDPFILAKLEEKGFKPAPQADKRTLLRRVSYDLVGLPPTDEEVRAFEADTSPDAYDKVIDRLLASPHYGERWGRYWLDVARYSDSKGYVFNEERRYPYAYTFRDWVIQAFNKDIPYDQFVVYQLAADRVTKDDNKENLAAMGFLTVGRRFLNNQADIIDDRLDVVGRGLLGISIGCARCHDHKFDPIPINDYYSLYAVFASSTEPKDLPLLGPSADKQANAAFDAELAKRKEAVEKTRQERLNLHLAELAKPESIQKQLNAGREAFPMDDQKIKQLEDKYKIDDFVIKRWKKMLMENKEALPPGIPVEELTKLVVAANKPDPLPDAKQETLRKLLRGPQSPINVSLADSDQIFNRADKDKIREGQNRIDELMVAHPGAPARAMVMNDLPNRVKQRVFKRGKPENPGDEVPAQFLEILSPLKREPFKDGSGRLELAKAIASKDNPLTARVFVNRVWQKFFGNGLMRTPSDFGTRSDPPTHPQLLDHLAVKFMNDGWSMKGIQKYILQSAAYRQASVGDMTLMANDPENMLISHMSRKRLDFEAMRDSMLFTSGRLDRKLYGRPVELLAQPFSGRRTVYGNIDRQNLPGLFRTFDFASPDMHSPQRALTTVPQQALFMLNSPFALEQARVLAARPEVAGEKDPRAKVEKLIRLVYGRSPSADEIDASLAYIAADENNREDVADSMPAWTYGYGRFNPAVAKVESFKPLPNFTAGVWQGSAKMPDAKLGWLLVNAGGGHPGKDTTLSSIRRWTAPRDGVIAINSRLGHGNKEGDGVLGRVISNQKGELGWWAVFNGSVEVKLKDVAVAKGEIIDFVVEPRANESFDSYSWAPEIKMVPREAAEAGAKLAWTATSEFSGPTGKKAERLASWEKFAQVLLASNEYVFVD